MCQSQTSKTTRKSPKITGKCGICPIVLDLLMANILPFNVPLTAVVSISAIKKFFSIVLLATCDARYRFTHIDLGAYGNQSDGGEKQLKTLFNMINNKTLLNLGIFQLSKFGKRLLTKNLPIPPPTNLPNTQLKIPHFFVGDAAFPLGINIMRPYPGALLPNDKEIFNKRLSRARRTIENAFGILVSRWRVLLTTLHLFPENAEKVVLSCVTLHNFIMLNDTSSYTPNNYVDWEDSNGEFQNGLWRNDIGSNIPSISPSSNLHHYGGRSSLEIRNSLCSFFTDI